MRPRAGLLGSEGGGSGEYEDEDGQYRGLDAV